MKESDITERIKELAREIAKYWRMEIYVGTWVCYVDVNGGRIIDIAVSVVPDEKDSDGVAFWVNNGYSNDEMDGYFGIPSIEDCLEKLRGLGAIFRLSYQKDLMKKNMEITDYFDGEHTVKEIFFRGYWFLNNPHEALLSALLEVVKGESQDG